MKKINLKPILTAAIAAVLLSSCSSALLKVQSNNALDNNASQLSEKQNALTKTQRKDWSALGLWKDTIPGMSVEKAYKDLIKNQKGETVIVAVLDAGVDIDHEDLKDIIWTNKKEIPGNGIDDDGNGYVDDVHGWNFLGDETNEQLEYTRIVKKYQDQFKGKSADQIAPEDQEHYKLYQRAKKEYDKEYSQAKTGQNNYLRIKKAYNHYFNILKKATGKSEFKANEILDLKVDDDNAKEAMVNLSRMLQQFRAESTKDMEETLKEGEDYFKDKLDYQLNLAFDGRKVVGDDVDDITDTDYGDNRVGGVTKDKEEVMHGTHVAGIIAAVRNNGIGMNGVANNVLIMPVRAVSEGDEYDKDIALGMRYAVDNGAKVINMSFGKYFSTHPDWVIDAMKYAAKHDVLLVNAAGNESLDLDTTRAYPNDQWPGHEEEFTDNVITVGALSSDYGKRMVANFSNYGKTNVDVFAPGVQIWATVPLSKYKYLSGTSMASPEVAGVAAMIRSYFPKLTAPEVKKVIMESGITTDKEVIVGGNPNDTKPFNEISKSGRMVNLYNALIYASKMAKNK